MYTLLVVDDERWIRMGIVKIIDRDTLPIGQVYEAATVRDAKALYHQRHPDIVLTDVCFPAENGCDFGEYIYRDNPTVRIVMISAYSEFSYAQQALRFRAANYLLKPVSKETLNQVVAQCIRELETLRPAAPTPPGPEPATRPEWRSCSRSCRIRTEPPASGARIPSSPPTRCPPWAGASGFWTRPRL